MESIFQLSNLLVLPFWLLMILLPHWRWTQRLMGSVLVVAPAALLYGIVLVPQAGDLLPALTDPSLAVIATGLGTPAGATLAWTHLVVFDLFVGRWIYLDGHRRRLSAWLISPILVATFMAGPLGLLLYLFLRFLIGYRSLLRPDEI